MLKQINILVYPLLKRVCLAQTWAMRRRDYFVAQRHRPGSEINSATFIIIYPLFLFFSLFGLVDFFSNPDIDKLISGGHLGRFYNSPARYIILNITQAIWCISGILLAMERTKSPGRKRRAAVFSPALILAIHLFIFIDFVAVGIYELHI